MLFQKQKIPCFTLVFDQVDIVKRSLDYLATMSDRLDIYVIENPSLNTPEIRAHIEALGASGAIKKYYLFEHNITGNAYDIVVQKELPVIRKSKYVVISDGDITSEDDWLGEERRILKAHPDVFACGTTLSRENLPLEAFPDAESWIPPDRHEHKDFFEVTTGGHLLLSRGPEFAAFMDWKMSNELSFLDQNMHRFCYEVLHKKWARTKRATAYHLTWDLYGDKNHPYTKMKLAKSFKETWYHKDLAGYSVQDF